MMWSICLPSSLAICSAAKKFSTSSLKFLMMNKILLSFGMRRVAAAICHEPDLFPHPAGADCTAAVCPAPEYRCVCIERVRYAHCDVACLRADRDSSGDVRAQRPRHGCHVGLSALVVRRRVGCSTTHASRVSRSRGWQCSDACRSRSLPITRFCQITITGIARFSFRVRISHANYRSAIAPSPANRSSTPQRIQFFKLPLTKRSFRSTGFTRFAKQRDGYSMASTK